MKNVNRAVIWILVFLFLLPIPKSLASQNSVDLLIDHCKKNTAYPKLQGGYQYNWARDGAWEAAQTQCWLSESDWTNVNYLQLELDDRYQLQQIDFSLRQGSDNNWVRNNTVIYASCDPAFKVYDVLWQSNGDAGTQKISALVPEEYSENYYRYIRFTKPSGNKNPVGLTEVEIYGNPVPYSDRYVSLTNQVDITATANGYDWMEQDAQTSYVAGNVLMDDGVWKYAPGPEEAAALTIDLKRESDIVKIRAVPVAEESAQKNFRILLSNDSEFSEYEIAGVQGEEPCTEFVVDELKGETYRYIRLEKTVAGEMGGFSAVEAWTEQPQSEVMARDLLQLENCVVTVSSQQNGMAGECTKDGSFAGGWESAADDLRPWILYDLGDTYGITYITVMPLNESTPVDCSQFEILASSDGETYQTIAAVGEEGVENGVFTDVDLMGVDARYIKIQKYEDGELGFAEVRIITNHEIQCLADFGKCGPEQVKALLEQYSIQEPILDLTEIDGLPEIWTEELSAFFVYSRDAFYQPLRSIDDLYHCLQAALVLSNLTAENLEQHREVLPGLDLEAGAQNWSEVYQMVKDRINSGDLLQQVIAKCNMLSKIQNGKNSAVAEVLKTYCQELGCDLEYAEERDVSLIEIAQKLDKNNAAAYYDGMEDVFQQLVDQIASSKGQNSKPSVSVGGGGNGGGQGNVIISNNPYVPPKEETIPENEPKQVQEVVGFSDLETVGWAQEAIQWLAEQEILDGKTEGVFAPNDPVRREEFVKILILAFEIEANGANTRIFFKDCTSDAWYYPYIRIAKSQGIVNGMDGNTFGVGQSITRQDMAVMLANVMRSKGISAVDDTMTIFADENEISPYAFHDVKALNELGIITGFEDGCFRPQIGATRAESAVMVYRLMQYLNEVAV